MKKLTLLFILLFTTSLIFAQKAKKSITLQEGENTVLMTKNPFIITFSEGSVQRVSEKGETFILFERNPDIITEKISSIEETIDLEKEGTLWENGKELLIISITKNENGYTANCYLFEI